MLRIIGQIRFMRLMVARITRQKHPEQSDLLVLLVRRHSLHLLRQRPDHARGRMRATNAGNLLTFKCAFVEIGIGRRSEERRVGKECRLWWSPYELKKTR